MSARRAQGRGWTGMEGRRWRWLAVDLVAMFALLALLGLEFWPVYASGQVFVAVLGFGLAGAAIALVGALLQWRAVAVALAALGAWFGLGTALIMPSAGLWGCVPTPRSLFGLLTGPVTAWRDMLTLPPPIGETSNLLVVPGLLALSSGVIAGSVSLRTEMPRLSWLPFGVAYLTAAALGSSVTGPPVLAGAGFVLVVLGWTSLRRTQQRSLLAAGGSRLRATSAIKAVAMLGLAGLAIAVVMPLIPVGLRATAREAVEPPIDLSQYPSPLQAFRANITEHLDDSLLEITGLPEGALVRVATLDSYDGVSFKAATVDDSGAEESTFTRVGEWIADDGPGEPGATTVRITGYTGVWVPTMGRTTQIRFTGQRRAALAENFFYHRASGTGLDTVGLGEGDSYELSFLASRRPPDQELADAAQGTADLVDVTGLSDLLIETAHAWTDGYPSAGAKALALETQLRGGYFSHGQDEEVRSLPGHSQARLATLLSDPQRMVGDAEQYASAMVLMARELGIPARVGYGYRGSGSSVVTGADVTAWAELQLEGHGWVVFDPTPPQDRILDSEDEPSPPTPEPQVANPPPPPQRPEPALPQEDLPITRADPPEQPDELDWGQIGAIAALTLIPLVTVVLPIVAVLVLKWRRRNRRRSASLPSTRASGAWSEVVDKARDLGRAPSAAATRSEQASQLLLDFPRIDASCDPLTVSRAVDRDVFAPEVPPVADVDQRWRETGELELGMRASVPRPRWWVGRASTRSFRKVRYPEAISGRQQSSGEGSP
ncbi:MAG: transglutaminase domain-containing protein [Arachnia sp.]